MSAPGAHLAAVVLAVFVAVPPNPDTASHRCVSPAALSEIAIAWPECGAWIEGEGDLDGIVATTQCADPATPGGFCDAARCQWQGCQPEIADVLCDLKRAVGLGCGVRQ